MKLLTCADIAGTSPKLWNAWKDRLLADLNFAARRAQRDGLENQMPAAERVAEARESVRQLVRERGYAYDNEECELGARCIAFPVRNYTGQVVAGFSVTGLAARMSDSFLGANLDAMRDTAARISAALGYEGEQDK